MRGTLFDERFRADGGGIIPAYAGNTRIHAPLLIGRRDHPRVCGEHQRVVGELYPRLGSSPRMRGTHSHFQPDVLTSGIIPAYAGNT